jgi:hypothetical protein
MKHYLLSVYQPDGDPPRDVLAAYPRPEESRSLTTSAECPAHRQEEGTRLQLRLCEEQPGR